MHEDMVRDLIGDLKQYTDSSHPDFDVQLAHELMFSVRPEWFTDEQRLKINIIRKAELTKD